MKDAEEFKELWNLKMIEVIFLTSLSLQITYEENITDFDDIFKNFVSVFQTEIIKRLSKIAMETRLNFTYKLGCEREY